MYVGESDSAARRGARPHLEYFFNGLLRMSREMFFAPGYVSAASAAGVMAAKQGLGTGVNDIDDLVERGLALVGSAATVRDTLFDLQRQLGFGTCVGVFQFGSLGHEAFLSSVDRFAAEVMEPIWRTVP